MSKALRASIIVSSYNYAPFLRQAIDSALAQTYRETEVIVVDDGSTDGSRDLIRSYGSEVIALLKENGGQASAFNAGWHAAGGEVIIFLDSDDGFEPTAVERAMELFAAAPIAKVHWPLWLVDKDGVRSGRVHPQTQLPEGDLRDEVLQSSPAYYGWPPTSGNAWSRSFLEKVLPMPEAPFRTCPDFYLSALAPLYGPMKRVDEPQGFWRLHGANNSGSDTFEQRVAVAVRRADLVFEVVREHCQKMNLPADVRVWKANSWEHRLSYALNSLTRVIPRGSLFVLIDDDQWGAPETLGGSRRLPFVGREGVYWGPPVDDVEAIAEVERLQSLEGIQFVVFAWPAFWWLDYYARFAAWLTTAFTSVLHDEQLAVFALHRPSQPSDAHPQAVPFDERFLERSWEWFKDGELRRLTATPVFTRDQQNAWFRSLSTRADYHIWGIEYEEEPVGAFGLKHVNSGTAQYWGYIGSKQHWGLGIGRWMVNEAIAIAKNLDLRQLSLDVSADNLRAIRLYEQCGFILRPSKEQLRRMERALD